MGKKSGSGIRDPESGVRNPGSGFRDPESGIRNLGSGIRLLAELRSFTVLSKSKSPITCFASIQKYYHEVLESIEQVQNATFSKRVQIFFVFCSSQSYFELISTLVFSSLEEKL
jgi:hypothetical protein